VDSLALFDYVRPLPVGTTTATLRRLRSIVSVCGHPQTLLVRVYATESAAALQTLLSQSLLETRVRVYAYPVATDVEVEMWMDNQRSTIQKCNIEGSGDILKPVAMEESSRRRWREVIQSLQENPVIIDVPAVESHSLLYRWMQVAESRMGKPMLMDDLIDAVLAMLQVKVASPVDEALIVKTTIQAGVMFVETLRGTDPVTLASRLDMVEAMTAPGMSVTPESLEAIDALVWRIHD
jgi:hypothetical protein